MIRSAVRTTLRSLLRSDLVAELNQTVIDVQRTDSMMAEYNCLSSSVTRFRGQLFLPITHVGPGRFGQLLSLNK